ncbi:MAG: zinc-dependent metalloprotease [Propionibacteriaceae bacterium]|nr:zinc-dependent metalloprotease [Propionibacteriaceae bacterium]
MSQLPFIDAEVAAAVGGRLVPPGPLLSPGEVADVVDGLRAAAAASVAPVARVTGLDADAGGPMLVVDRPTWIRANADMALTMLAEATGGPYPAPERLRDKVAARANGAQLGMALAAFGARILGQYLPFLAEPRLVLVAPNVAKIERAMGVDPDDFRLWVCLHEQTHRLQFARAPWLRGHLLAAVGELIDGDAPAPEAGAAGGRRRPRSIVDVVTSPGQQEVFERVSAVMSLLEGYADDMMDRVGPDVVPTVATIRRRFDARRNRGGWTKVLNNALGMDLKLAQYRDGAAFCREVIARVGVTGLNAVYDRPENLPSPGEIEAPARWIHRVHG